MPRPEPPSRLPLIVVGGLLLTVCLAVIWQEVRYRGATNEIDRLAAELSRESVESRQNLAALELAANAYQAEARRLTNELASATADRPLDRLKPFGGAQDVEQCQTSLQEVFANRVMPLARKACAGAKPTPALQAAWKAIDRDASDWTDFLRARFPGLGPQCFEPAPKAADPSAGRVNNDISAYPDLQSLIDSYCIISPDRNFCLYLDYPTGQPDSSARLWDLKANRELWKLDCGPSCHWDYAVWVDAGAVAVMGLAESYYQPLQIFATEVRLVQIKDGKVSVTGVFRGPDVDPAAAGGGTSYAEQHRKWLARKGKSRAQ